MLRQYCSDYPTAESHWSEAKKRELWMDGGLVVRGREIEVLGGREADREREGERDKMKVKECEA